jgi:ribosomal protein S18 acetylase RimI-like enzyme
MRRVPEIAAEIVPVRSAGELAAVAELFAAYAASLSMDLAYQGFAAELASLPGRYAPPAGEILLARGAAAAIGCVALRPLAEPGVAAMKRLYVRPEGRGLGLGAELIAEILRTAGRIGYREVRLDTLPDMAAAIALYEGAGFVRTAPYYDTPVAGTVFLARAVGGRDGKPGQTAA